MLILRNYFYAQAANFQTKKQHKKTKTKRDNEDQAANFQKKK